MISFVSKGFPHKELFVVIVLFCAFSTRNIFNFFINFSFLTNIFLEGIMYSICALNAVKSESVNFFESHVARGLN